MTPFVSDADFLALMAKADKLAEALTYVREAARDIRGSDDVGVMLGTLLAIVERSSAALAEWERPPPASERLGVGETGASKASASRANPGARQEDDTSASAPSDSGDRKAP